MQLFKHQEPDREGHHEQRIGVAPSSDQISYPDEILQYLEQGHRLAFGYGFVPWEYVYGTRNFLIPGLISGIPLVTSPPSGDDPHGAPLRGRRRPVSPSRRMLEPARARGGSARRAGQVPAHRPECDDRVYASALRQAGLPE